MHGPKLTATAMISLCFCYGCSTSSITFKEQPPQMPQPPIVLLTDVDDAREAVVSDVIARSVHWEATVPGKGKTLAILPASGPNGSGDLLTTTLTIELTKSGVSVSERQVAEALRNELDTLEFFKLPTGETLTRIGQSLAADYLLVASVATVNTDMAQVDLPARKFDPNDLPRYAADYMRWKRDAFAYLDKLSEAADVFRIKPQFDRNDEYQAHLLRNAITKVRRDIEKTDFIGIQEEQAQVNRPALLYPDFFNRAGQGRFAGRRTAQTDANSSADLSVISPFGPYGSDGYQPLLHHLANDLPRSPRRIEFEWLQGEQVTFHVRRTNASVAFRLINASTGEYTGLGVFEVDDNSEPQAITRLAEKLASVVAERFR